MRRPVLAVATEREKRCLVAIGHVLLPCLRVLERHNPSPGINADGQGAGLDVQQVAARRAGDEEEADGDDPVRCAHPDLL